MQAFNELSHCIVADSANAMFMYTLRHELVLIIGSGVHVHLSTVFAKVANASFDITSKLLWCPMLAVLQVAAIRRDWLEGSLFTCSLEVRADSESQVQAFLLCW